MSTHPLRRALIVGINHYEDTTTLKSLSAPSNDAQAIYEVLSSYGNFRKIRILPAKRDIENKHYRVSQDIRVKKKRLISELINLFTPKRDYLIPDVALFYFSGHGARKEKEDLIDQSYLCTSDDKYAISLRQLGEIIKESKAKTIIVWLDCCYSGEILDFKNEVFANKAGYFIAASTPTEEAYELSSGISVLTNTLANALNPEKHGGLVNNLKLSDTLKLLQGQMQLVLDGYTHDEIILTRQDWNQKDCPKHLDTKECPYRGFESFNEKDGELFFGREGLIKELLSKLKNNKIVIVTGASGIGKSSLVRAGLMYHLQKDSIPGSSRWHYIYVAHPSMMALRDAVINELEISDGRAIETEDGFINCINAQTENIVLIIDQLEEVFTLISDNERKHFMEHILAAETKSTQLHTVFTIRNEFLDKLGNFPALSLYLKNAVLIMTSIVDEVNLREIITYPANSVNIHVEEELTKKIIEEIMEPVDGLIPDSLSLLQYALTCLWDNCKRSGTLKMTLEDYKLSCKGKGLHHFLEEHANAFLNHQTSDEQRIIEWVFLQLIKVNDDIGYVRQPKSQEFLIFSRPKEFKEPAISSTLNKLTKNRLLSYFGKTADGQETIGIAHDFLIKNWPLLSDWAKNKRSVLILRDWLNSEEKIWCDNNKDISFLLKGKKLKQAEDYLKKHNNYFRLPKNTVSFIKISQKDELGKYIKKLLWVFLSISSVVILFFTSYYRENTLKNFFDGQIKAVVHILTKGFLQREEEQARLTSNLLIQTIGCLYSGCESKKLSALFNESEPEAVNKLIKEFIENNRIFDESQKEFWKKFYEENRENHASLLSSLIKVELVSNILTDYYEKHRDNSGSNYIKFYNNLKTGDSLPNEPEKRLGEIDKTILDMLEIINTEESKRVKVIFGRNHQDEITIEELLNTPSIKEILSQ